jgi:hypothetical protein
MTPPSLYGRARLGELLKRSLSVEGYVTRAPDSLRRTLGRRSALWVSGNSEGRASIPRYVGNLTRGSGLTPAHDFLAGVTRGPGALLLAGLGRRRGSAFMLPCPARSVAPHLPATGRRSALGCRPRSPRARRQLCWEPDAGFLRWNFCVLALFA